MEKLRTISLVSVSLRPLQVIFLLCFLVILKKSAVVCSVGVIGDLDDVCTLAFYVCVCLCSLVHEDGT